MSPTARRALGGLAGAAAMIAVITVVSRLLGFARWLVQAHALGTGDIGGAYNAANTLPNILFEVAAGGALAGAIVPLLALPIAREARREVDSIASGALGWTLAVLVPLGAVLAALSGPIADVWPNLDGSQRDLLRFFILVFAVQVPLYGVAVLLYAVLQAHKRFFWPAFAPVLSSLVVIATYLLYGVASGGERDDPTVAGHTALTVLAWGTTLGVAAMCLPMFVPVHRLGVRLRPTLRFPPGVGRRLARLASAGVGSLVAQQLALLVVIVVSSARGTLGGTYSVFLWSQQVYLLPYAVLVVPLATSTFPRLSARAAERRHEEFARMASGTTRGVLAAAALGAAAVAAAAPAIADVFAVVATSRAMVTAMAFTITAMMPGLLGFAAMFHGSRSLYALERGRSAVVANVVGWGVVAVATVALAVLATPHGHDADATLKALGIANSVGMVVGGALAVAGLRRAAGAGATRGLARTLAVLVVGGLAGAFLGRWVCDTVQRVVGHDALSAVGAAAGGGIVAAIVVAVAVVGADRGTIRDLRAVEAEPVRVAATTPGASAAAGAAVDSPGPETLGVSPDDPAARA